MNNRETTWLGPPTKENKPKCREAVPIPPEQKKKRDNKKQGDSHTNTGGDAVQRGIEFKPRQQNSTGHGVPLRHVNTRRNKKKQTGKQQQKRWKNLTPAGTRPLKFPTTGRAGQKAVTQKQPSRHKNRRQERPEPTALQRPHYQRQVANQKKKPKRINTQRKKQQKVCRTNDNAKKARKNGQARAE